MQNNYMSVTFGGTVSPPARKAAPSAPRYAAPNPTTKRRAAYAYDAPNAAYAPRTTRAARTAARKRKRRKRRLRLMLLLTLAVLIPLAISAQSRRPRDAGLPEPSENGLPAALVPTSGPPYTVAIDAGHGGTDVGAQGFVEESALTEATIGALEQWLMQDANFTPVRTHPYDTFTENTDRAETANHAGAALMLSVHGNSNPYSDKTTGFECYAQPPGRKYHDASLYFAHLIAGRIGGTGQRLRGEAGVRYIYYVGDDATGYEKQVIEESDTTVREEQTFGILEKTACPAVLAEQCFVTSAADVEAWGSAEGCRRAARIYYEAICEYFGTEPLAE